MKKLNFDELENTLTRTEMKSIIAGSGSSAGCYRCCWDGGGPCSGCIPNSDPNSCEKGSHAHQCHGC